MKQINNIRKVIIVFYFLLFTISHSFAGNPQRAGQAGASELLINPWARTSGWGGSNVAGITGLESQFSNVAGLYEEETVCPFKAASVVSILQLIWFGRSIFIGISL